MKKLLNKIKQKEVKLLKKIILFYLWLFFGLSINAQNIQINRVPKKILKEPKILLIDSSKLYSELRKGLKYESFDIDDVKFSNNLKINEAFKQFNNELIDFYFSKTKSINSDLIMSTSDSLLNNCIYFGTPMILLDTLITKEFNYHTRGFIETSGPSWLPLKYFNKKINLRMYFLILMELITLDFKTETKKLVIDDILLKNLKNHLVLMSNESFRKLFSAYINCLKSNSVTEKDNLLNELGFKWIISLNFKPKIMRK